MRQCGRGISNGDIQQRIEQCVRKQVRLQAEVNQLRVLRVVIVVFGFHARVRAGGSISTSSLIFLAGGLHHSARVSSTRKLFGELVVDAALPGAPRGSGRRSRCSERCREYRGSRVVWPAFAVDRERMTDGRFTQKRLSTVPKTSS